MDTHASLSPQGLQRFGALRTDAINAVSARFYADHSSIYARFGDKGREACAEDLGFHLEFLRPVLEFGLLAPLVEYLHWLASVLEARGVPTEHVAQSLDWLGEFFAAKLDPADAEVVVAALDAVKAKFLEQDDSLPEMYAKLPTAWPERANFESALIAGDRRQAATIVGRYLDQGCGLVDTELHVIQPALYGIGQQWQRNQVSVAQEHLATAIAQSVMVQGMLRSIPAPSNGRKILLACVEGNQHAVGLQMVADAFEIAGWEVNCLGANVPTASLVLHAAQWKPNLVGLSISFPQQFKGVKSVISRMNDVIGAHRPPVIIGGMAINNFARLADRIGANAWSPDAAAAVVSGTRIASPPGAD